jgi:hypothetical protein
MFKVAPTGGGDGRGPTDGASQLTRGIFGSAFGSHRKPSHFRG